MKNIIYLSSLVSSFLLAQEFEYRGSVGAESTYIDHNIVGKRDTQNALRARVELKQKIANGQMVLNAKAIMAKDDSSRRYVELNDLYYKHEFENSDLLIGRNTRFWGAMEFYNHTDAFNTKDWRDNPFDYDAKLGSNNIAYTHYFENSDLALIARIGQEGQRVQDNESINNFLPANYNDTLQTQKGENRPTVYLKYTGSAEETQFDYAVIYQNGYDEQRYLAPVGASFYQNAYLVNKLMAYATWVSGETIYKTELAYTKSDEEKVSDYAQYSLGVEHTLYGVWGKSDVGLLAEYYKYDVQQSNKFEAKDFGNFFQNDVMLGLRMTLNDSADSDILGGISIDQDNQEKMIFVEYNTRIFEKYKLGLSYQHLEPKSGSMFQELDSAMVEFGYYF